MFKRNKKRKSKKKYLKINGIVYASSIVIATMIMLTFKNPSIQEVFNSFPLFPIKQCEIEAQTYCENYGGITFQVTISMVVAIQTISITIFVFLKSLLDRKKEEQIYSKRTLDIYISNRCHFF